MFDNFFSKSAKDVYINKETTPISVSGCNCSPYMQELLYNEEKRSKRHLEEVHNRQEGYIK